MTININASRTREYSAWLKAKHRCFNPKAHNYAYYGGRGITMSKEWQSSFSVFLRDMGPCPNGYTLDRIDNSIGYGPGNCRWASMRTQSNNRRSNVLAAINGETKTIADWCRVYKISRSVFAARTVNGWDLLRALSTPVRAIATGTSRAKTLPLSQWAKASGIPVGVLGARIRRLGWSTDEAMSTPLNRKQKISKPDALLIRQRQASGESQLSLAREFGVHQSTISLIINNHRQL